MPMLDTRTAGPKTALMTVGPVERAIRSSVTAGEPLKTPTGRGEFRVAQFGPDALVLLLGAKGAWTPLSWRALEDVPDLRRGGGWIRVGSTFSVEAEPGTLDEHLKRYLQRATAGWVAVVLERAGVVEIDRARPARVRLRSGFDQAPEPRSTVA